MELIGLFLAFVCFGSISTIGTADYTIVSGTGFTRFSLSLDLLSIYRLALCAVETLSCGVGSSEALAVAPPLLPPLEME